MSPSSLSSHEVRDTKARRASFCLDPAHATILVVDDSPVDRKVIEACLDRLDWPARTEYAADGEEGWRRLQGIRPPVLVMSDLDMPRLDGIELVRRIRGDDATVVVPVFMVSGSADTQQVHDAMAAGATGFFPKPDNAEGAFTLVKVLHAFAFQHCFTTRPD